jgi:hypothetical protein
MGVFNDYVDRRRAKYLAKTLEKWDVEVEPKLMRVLEDYPGDTQDLLDAIDDFKRTVRGRYRDFATDVTDVMKGADTPIINDLAVEIRDRLGA